MNRFTIDPRFISICGIALFLSACLSGPDDSGDSTELTVSDEGWVPALPSPPAGWPAILWPEDNPYSPEKAILGRRLFFEKRLSRDSTVSCSWCHSPSVAFADRHTGAISRGINGLPTQRNTPTLANVAFGRFFLLDGGAGSLEEQAPGPLFAENEMDMTGPEIEARLSGDTLYARLLRQAYGDGAVTLDRLVRALATYQRTLISARAPYDRWRAGDEDALSPAAKRGEELFMSDKTSCSQCHTPPLFTNGGFHNNGIDSGGGDPGRALVTGLSGGEGKFKVPTLRNVAITYPYMHDGSFETLQEIVEHYNSGGKPHPNADTLIRPLGLTPYELHDLVIFLEALTDPDFRPEPPP